ncbi:MAG: hypothetical protein ACREBQ_12170 [Nitrososphaerales archaeon]
MLTPHQQDMVRRFFLAISALDQSGDRYDTKKTKYVLQILHNVVTTDLVKSGDFPEFEPGQVKKQHDVFQQLSVYHAETWWKKMASGFSPLKLGLTPTECRFALDEIVGHPRWNE